MLFYTDNGLITSTNTVWLQWGFVVLIGLFEWVGIITKVEKTVVMVCQPGNISGKYFDVAYGWWMNNKGDPHHVKQR